MLSPLTMVADNWDFIQLSGEYYYGVGQGATVAEASEQALADLVSMIATHVSNDFMSLEDETIKNGTVDHQSRVRNCVKSYSQSSLSNVKKWIEGEAPNITVRCYMHRSELARIYDGRIAKAKDMMLIAKESLERGKVDMALQYYYWAYSLVRSVQHPNEVKDDKGHVLVNWLPLKIDEILSDINVKFEKRDGDFVDLLFDYKGKPVSCLEFTYNDGREDVFSTAKDGRGSLEMASGYDSDTYHINIEYEYKGQARGDLEMQNVLDVITRKAFPKSEVTIKGRNVVESVISPAMVQTQQKDITGVNLKPKASQTTEQPDDYANITSKVIEAIRNRNSFEAASYFTFEGKEIFRQLIGYGMGRVVGNPNLQFFRSANGKVVSRGLQMAFSFKQGSRKTFVEDVVFTFNSEKKIENIAFGLGQVAENDILCKHPQWKEETREMLMEFLENYKTAYCLKRLDYIRDIFADDAVIIIGNVAKRKTAQSGDRERSISLEGREVIHYNRYTKDEYLKNLKRCFDRNEFINIRFTNNDIQWLEKYKKEEIFGIQIGQEYNSTSYGDKGFLFLLVNMTNHDEPQIKVRTWQPNEVDMNKLYHAGDFYNE